MTEPLPIAEPRAPSAKARAIAGSALGLALFAAAVWAVLTSEQDLARSWDAARHAPWWIVAAVLALPIVNWVLISLSFRVLQSRYGPVGTREMAALIGAAWLLNYLPLKPGMFGRLAYHKHVNKIRYADSARVVFISVGLTGAAIGLLLVIALLVQWTDARFAWLWVLPVPAALAATWAFFVSRNDWAWRLAAAALFRYLDTMVWIARYAAAFALIGSPLDFQTALFVAAVSQLALLIPISGNGLGIREWGVRLVTEPVGLLAEIINRAAELAVSLPIGLAGSAYSARALAAARRVTPPEPSP